MNKQHARHLFADSSAAVERNLQVVEQRPNSLPGTRTAATTIIAGCAVLLDGTLIVLAVGVAYYLRYVARLVPVERGTIYVGFSDWIPFCILFCLVELSVLARAGAYRNPLGRDGLGEFALICRTSLISVGLVAIITAFLPVEFPSRLVLVYGCTVLVVFLTLGKLVMSTILGHLYRSGWNTKQVLLVGTSSISKMAMQNLLRKRSRGYNLVGFLEEGRSGMASGVTAEGGPDFGRFKCLGSVANFPDVIQRHAVNEVIIASPALPHAQIAEICGYCENLHVAVRLIPDLFEMRLSRVHLDDLAGIPLIDMHSPNPRHASHVAKRGIDILAASLLLLLASPVLLGLAIAIKLDSPGPCLNRQQRIGKGGKPFTFYKFRSMYVESEKGRQVVENVGDLRIFKDRSDPRRTRVGRFIRPLSLDELPQLFNILRGDMSLVGPRPPLPSEVANYEPRHWKRLEVIGGLTGLWQVSGRSNIESFEEIVLMDAYYIDNWSLTLDLKILIRTVLAVLSREGAY